MAADTLLELASTDEIVTELFRRHDRVLLVCARDDEKRQDLDEITIYCKGGVLSALGMIEYARVFVSQSVRQVRKE